LNPTLSSARADGGLVQFGSFASDNLGIQRTGCYTVLDMEEEARYGLGPSEASVKAWISTFYK